MKKKRTKFRSLTSSQTKERNKKIYQKFVKLSSTGKYGKMQLYQLLADEFDIDERNSVYGIIRKFKQNLESNI